MLCQTYLLLSSALFYLNVIYEITTERLENVLGEYIGTEGAHMVWLYLIQDQWGGIWYNRGKFIQVLVDELCVLVSGPG